MLCLPSGPAFPTVSITPLLTLSWLCSTSGCFHLCLAAFPSLFAACFPAPPKALIKGWEQVVDVAVASS